MQSTPIRPDSAEVREALDEVLSRPEFVRTEVPGFLRTVAEVRAWLIEQWNAFWRWFLGLFDPVLRLQEQSPLLFWTMVAAIIALVLWTTLWYVSRRTRGSLLARARSGSGEAAGEPLRPLGWWEERAREALEAGRFEEAAHALYMALLLAMDQGGSLRVDPSKTPGDYRREARRRDRERARTLDGFLRVFEPIAFGGRAPASRALDRMSALAREGGVRV